MLMIEELMTMRRVLAEPAIDETAPSFIFHELRDGRLVPVEMGGMVELALYEFGGKLVDALSEERSIAFIGAN